MDKKLNVRAFTLVELLGVIVILSVIAVIIYPVFNTVIDNSKNKLYEEQIDMLESASRRWGVDNSNYMPEDETTDCVIEFNNLMSGGYIADKDIIDPRNSDLTLSGCIVVHWNASKNQYVYQYNGNNTECTSISTCVPQ